VVDVGIAGGLFGRHVRGRAECHADGGEALSVLAWLTALATPKSATTAWWPESSTLSGLMSRCTTPRVGVRERIRDVLQNADASFTGKLAVAAEARAERFALDERHRVIEEVVGTAGREERDDVRSCREAESWISH